MKKQIIHGETARDAYLMGVEKLAKAVVTTMGPKGNNVAIARSWGPPNVIRDGASVAKEIFLEDPFEDMGAQLIKQAALKTNEAAGDGTTTATLLAWKMSELGNRYVQQGKSARIMREGMNWALDKILEEIKELKTDVKEEDWEKVATLSSQSKEIGSKIAKAYKIVGKNGLVEVGEGDTAKIELEHKDGMQFDSGYLSERFVTKENEAELSNPLILVTDQKIISSREIGILLEQVASEGRSLLIISDDIEFDALIAITYNKETGALKVLPVKLPGYGDPSQGTLEDISILTGAEFISKKSGKKIRQVTIDMLGEADAVRSTKTSTSITGGKGSKQIIKERIKQLNKEIKENTSDFEQERLKERKAKLAGGVAVIKVGANTEVEMKDLLERVKDAKEATSSALQSGIVPGGGTVLFNISKGLDLSSLDGDQLAGAQVVVDACKEPLSLLAKHSDMDPLEVRKNTSPGKGLNALTGEYVDLVKEGIIEPSLVVSSALENAVSVASMIITTDCLVADIKEDKDE